MMPLKEQTTENKGENKQESEALKTEEILSLLSKTRQDFIKDQEILENIPNLFKKKTLIELANNSANKKSKSQEIEKSEIKEKDENKETDNGLSADKEEELEKKIDEKKYTEVEAKKMANDLAKEYYNKGYYLGIKKKTKEELEKGEKALAVTFKNIIDNIFITSPEFSEKITSKLNQKISSIIKEIIGYEIDTRTDFFVKKITELCKIFDENNKIKILLNESDYNSVKKFCSENKIDLNISLLADKNLQRGDLKIKSGSIEISEIIDDKIKLSESSNIKKEINNLQDKVSVSNKETDKDLTSNFEETKTQKKEEHANS